MVENGPLFIYIYWHGKLHPITLKPQMLKKIPLVLVCAVVALATVPLFSFHGDQNPDTLLKRAQAEFSKDPSAGIAMASLSLKIAQSLKSNLKVIKSLNVLAEFYWTQKKYDSSAYYSRQALKACNNAHLDTLKSDAWMILGLGDYSKGKYEQAINEYGLAVPLYQKRGSGFSLALTYYNLGLCEDQLARYADAVTYYMNASVLFEKLKADDYLNYTYNSLALCFVSLGKYETAIVYNKKALLLRQKEKNNVLIAQSLNNIGFVFLKRNEPDSAIIYLSHSMALYQNERDSSLLVSPLQNIGGAWKGKRGFKKAKSYVLRSLSIAHIYGMQEEIAHGNLSLGEIYLATGEYPQAEITIDRAEAAAQRLKLNELVLAAYNIKAELYKQRRDYKKALFYTDKRNNLKDSLFTTAQNKIIYELEIKYEASQRTRDIALLRLQNNYNTKIVRQQRILIIVLIVSAVLLVLLFIITYNNFRLKNRANQRIQTLMQELHHRVKNNLQILAGMFTLQVAHLQDEQVRSAVRENESRLNSMNLVHHKLYLDNMTTKIEMEAYLTQLLHHVKNSFGAAAIRVLIIADPVMIEADKAVAIGLLVNELATNAFKYAFIDGQGEIHLTLRAVAKSKIQLVFSDNGRGKPDMLGQDGLSFGLKLVNLMVQQLGATMETVSAGGLSYHFEIDL